MNKLWVMTPLFMLLPLADLSAQRGNYNKKTNDMLNDTTRHLQEVVVIGKYLKDIVPAQVLGGKKLKRLNSHSVSDALRYFSGVQIKDYGGIGGLKTVNIRSMGSQHVGVFYDGIQISNAQNGTVDLGKFSLDNMELLSVYNGQKSNIFQSAKDFASAGAVYMVSRKPSFEESKRNNLNVKLKTGSFDLITLSCLWERQISGKISASANVEFLNTSGKYRYRYEKSGGYKTRETRRNGDVVFLRAESALFGKIDKGEWQVKSYFYNSKRGYPGAAVKKDYEISLLNEDRQRDLNFFVQSSLEQALSSFYSYRVRAKYAYDFMNYVMPPESTVQPMDNRYKQHEVYLTAAHLFSFTRRWSVNFSGDLQWNRLDANGTKMFNKNFAEPRRYTVLGAAATSLRLKKMSIQGSMLYTYVHDRSARGYTVAKDKSIFTPTLIASYKPLSGTDLNIRAFYKKIFRMPTFNDLYYVQVGNRLLKPEYTTQYNIGAAWKKRFGDIFLAGIDLTVDVYYNEVKDKIIATPTSNQLVWTMLNLGYVEIKGVDAVFNPCFRFGETDISIRFTYTYQKAQDFTKGKRETGNEETVISTYGDQVPYIPWHSGSAVVNATYRSWDLNYSLIYTGKRYMLGGNIPVNYIQPWYTHDLSVSRNISFRCSELKIIAEVNNIFDQQYEVVKWYPMPGTNLKIILSMTL